MERIGTAREAVRYDVTSGVGTVTLNRPAKLNAWTAAMEREVRAAMHEADADEEVRVIVLTGAGRGFCAGADLELLNALRERGAAGAGFAGAGAAVFLRNEEHVGERAGVRPDYQKKYSYFPAISKPVIAAVNGPAVGLGMILALYCDIRLAAESARFGTAFARRGLIGEYGVAWLLPRLVGVANALDLLLSARLIDAAEALRMGLVNRVLPDEGFAEAVRAYAVELAQIASPRSIRVIKRQVYDGLFQTLGEAFEAAEEEMILSLASEDFREGVAHFMEKRPPRFTGR